MLENKALYVEMIDKKTDDPQTKETAEEQMAKVIGAATVTVASVGAVIFMKAIADIIVDRATH